MKVIINADGRTCTTVNPYKYPEYNDEYDYPGGHEAHQRDIDSFNEAESERQTFEIDFGAMPFSQKELLYMKNELDYLGVDKGEALRPGTTHDCEIVNGKAVIK